MSTLTGRQTRKTINFMRMYGASEIMVGRRIGEYPIMAIDYSSLELRVLAHYLGN